jgi:hypothetical protein
MRNVHYLCIAASALLGATNVHAESPASKAAFERLATLVGEWRGIADGQKVTVTYSLIADGSTLVEEFLPPDRSETMLTLFAVDGDRVIATHYCAAGNQPQMVTGPITRSEDNPFKFSLTRITGRRSSDEDWHNTGLEIRLEDKDRLTQRWTYVYKGKQGTNTFHFTRKR